MKKLRGIIFDVDGTLLDSMGMWSELDRVFLRENGVDPPDDISDIVKKMTVETSSAYFVERFKLDMTPEDVKNRVEELAAEAYRTHLPLKNGAKDFLAAAAERGIPMAVASANYPGLLDAAFRRLGIDGFFRTVLTPGEQLAGKHEPDIYLEAARLLGSEPAETAVIEDALHAAETAKAAGFYTVGFRDVSSRQDWDALAAICDRVTDSWDALRSGGFLQCF
ncbi:MAG: HAD family phosphatase [Oscillospiraceae bacterium]|nr:HAD family phosphatase [Oscillospiraceae bacterium]